MSGRDAERRVHPRSRRGFKHARAGEPDVIINHVENISCSGVLCRTRRPVPEMTKMEIVLDLPAPENRSIEAEGIVVRCDASDRTNSEFYVAILYTRLGDDDQHAIRRYVEHDLAHHGAD
jgi:hypothetical protein